jgi:hypothetical protein
VKLSAPPVEVGSTQGSRSPPQMSPASLSGSRRGVRLRGGSLSAGAIQLQAPPHPEGRLQLAAERTAMERPFFRDTQGAREGYCGLENRQG